MTYKPPERWALAVIGAVLLSLVSAGCVAVICSIDGASLLVAALAGAIVGCCLSLTMLWLFYWHQVTAREIWQSISALWNEFGKY
jgi:uncharacterized membrane protein